MAAFVRRDDFDDGYANNLYHAGPVLEEQASAPRSC